MTSILENLIAKKQIAEKRVEDLDRLIESQKAVEKEREERIATKSAGIE